jgi:hypothetical protein
MRQVPESHGEHLPSAKLYLDDVRRVVEILRQASEEVSLLAEGFALDNWEELPALKKECIRKLSISSHSPYVSLDLGPSQIFLYIKENTPLSRGLFEQIKTVVRARSRPFKWLTSFTALTLAAFVAGSCLGSLAVLGASIYTKNVLAFATLLFVVLIFGSWSGYGYYVQLSHYSTVIPKYRIESPGFFKRNGDNIFLALISAVIGAAIMYAVKV